MINQFYFWQNFYLTNFISNKFEKKVFRFGILLRN